MTVKKCTKKRDARAKLLFCYYKPIAYLLFLLPSPSSLLKLPTSKRMGNFSSQIFLKEEKDGKMGSVAVRSLLLAK